MGGVVLGLGLGGLRSGGRLANWRRFFPFLLLVLLPNHCQKKFQFRG